MSTTQSVQCFGKKKTATAVAHCKVRRVPSSGGSTIIEGRMLSFVVAPAIRETTRCRRRPSIFETKTGG